MSLSHEDALSIMAYADDELDPRERERVESMLEQSAEARDVLASFERSPVGQWVRDHAEASGGEHDADAIVANVMAKLPTVSAAPVVSLRRGDATKVLVALSFGVIAAAAAIALYLHFDRAVPVAHHVAPSPPGSSQAPIRGVALKAGEAPHDVTVEEVTSPDHHVSVFEIPASGAAASVKSSSVVIWVDEEKDAN